MVVLMVLLTMLATEIHCREELFTTPGILEIVPCDHESDTECDLSETTTTGDSFIDCGPGKCSGDEVCVSWEKHCGNSKCDAEIELEYHECFPKEGEHWTKINPTGGKLCADNETHQIMDEKKQPCLKDPIPCSLHWWYKCVAENESPHSCHNKKCPEHFACYETIECDTQPPCILKAKCDFCLNCKKPTKNADDVMKSVDANHVKNVEIII